MSPLRRRLARHESGSDSDAQIAVPSTKRQHRDSCEGGDSGISQVSTVKSTALSESEGSLLQSLNASQGPSTPALPAEILLIILEHVPTARLFDLRLVCKSFCTAIETSVFYHHIQQAELIGYLGKPYSHELLNLLSPEDYWRFALVRAPFLVLDGVRSGQAV